MESYGTLYPIEQIKEEYEKAEDKGEYDDFEEWYEDHDYRTYENFGGDFETDHEEADIDGVKVCVDCYYGEDY